MKGKSESEVAQSCPTLSDPMDYSPPGSSIHGILQARSGVPLPSPQGSIEHKKIIPKISGKIPMTKSDLPREKCFH